MFGAMEFIQHKERVLAGIFKILNAGGELWVTFEIESTHQMAEEEIDIIKAINTLSPQLYLS